MAAKQPLAPTRRQPSFVQAPQQPMPQQQQQQPMAYAGGSQRFDERMGQYAQQPMPQFQLEFERMPGIAYGAQTMQPIEQQMPVQDRYANMKTQPNLQRPPMTFGQPQFRKM